MDFLMMNAYTFEVDASKDNWEVMRHLLIVVI